MKRCSAIVENLSHQIILKITGQNITRTTQAMNIIDGRSKEESLRQVGLFLSFLLNFRKGEN